MCASLAAVCIAADSTCLDAFIPANPLLLLMPLVVVGAVLLLLLLIALPPLLLPFTLQSECGVQIIFVNMVCTPDGLSALAAAYPAVKVVTCAVDDG